MKFDDADFKRGIGEAESRGRGLGDVMAGVGKAVIAGAAAMGAALVGIGVAAFNVGRDFDNSMGAIRAQTGLTADEITKIGDGFKQMALDGGYSARELADAFAGIAVYGQDTADALNIMSAAQTLAMATGEDLGNVAYFLGNYLLKVGKDSSYADKYIDLFAQGVRNTGIGLNDLQNYVFRMTPAFQQFGASGETNIAILTRMYQAGIRGANLYSGMGTIMMDFATAGDVSSAAIERFNIQMYDANGVARSNEEIMFDTARAMAEYGDQTYIAQFITDSMNQTQQAAWFEFMNLANEIQNEVIPAFDAYGVAATMAEYSAGGMEQSLRVLGNTIEWAKLKVWDFIATPVAETLAGAAEGFQGLATTFVPLFGGALQGLIGILTGAEGASEKFADSIGNIANEINKQLPVFLERGIDIVVNLITGVASALPTLVQGVVEIVPTVARTILDALPELITAGVEVVVALINGIATMLPELVPIAIEGIITIVNAILGNLPLLLDAAIGLIGALAAAITDPANLAKLRDAAPQLIRVFALYLGGKAVLANIAVAGSAIISKLIATLGLGKIKMALTGGLLAGAFNKSLAGGAGAKKGLLAALGPKGWIAAGIIGLGVVAWANREKVGAFFSNMGDRARESFPRVMEAVDGTVERIRDFASGLRETGAEMVDNFKNGFESRREQGFGVISSFAGSVLDVMGDSLPGIFGVAAGAMGSFMDGFASRRAEGYGVVRSFFGGILDAGRETADRFMETGGDMMKGLKQGIGGAAGRVADAARDVASKAINGVRNFLGISSPSKLFADAVGKPIAEGMAIGIDHNGHVAVMAAEKMSSEVFDRATSWIGQYTKTLGYLPAEELKMWEHLLANAEISGNERIKVEQNVARLQNKISQERFEFSKNWIEQQLALNLLSAQEEIEAWERAVAHHAEGTEQRIAAEEQLARRREELNRDQKAALAEMERLEQAYIDAVDNRTQALVRTFDMFREVNLSETNVDRARYAMERATEVYRRATEELMQAQQAMANAERGTEEFARAQDRVREANQNVARAHEELTHATESASRSQAEIMADNLQGQLDNIRDWESQMAELSRRGVYEGLIEHFRAMGPASSRYLQDLNASSDAELSRLASLYKEKHSEARRLATNELEGLRRDTDQQISEMLSNKAMQASSQSNPIGENMIRGIIQGFDSRSNDLMRTVERVLDEAVARANRALQIRSPSRVFAKMGEQSGEGYIVGWEDKARDIYNSLGAVFNGIDKYAKTPELSFSAGSYASSSRAGNGAVAQPQSSRGGDTYILQVDMDRIDDFYKLKQMFDKLKHYQLVSEGV